MSNDNSELFGAPASAPKKSRKTKEPKPAKAKVEKPAKASPKAKAEKSEKSSAKKKSEVTGDPSQYPAYSAFKPAASLLPAYVRERRVNDKTMRVSIYSSLGVLALILAAVGSTFFLALNAQGDRNDAQNDRQAAQVEADRLKPISSYYDGLKERQRLATTAMQSDLDRAKILKQIYSAAQGKVGVSQVELNGQPPCQGPDPFVKIPALGCVNLTVSGSGSDVAGFVDALNEIPMFSAAYSSSMFGGDKAGDTGTPVTVNYSSDALTMRFVPDSERDQTRATIESQSAAGGATAGADQ